MTSLIFGSIYLGHQGFVKHRHEKQRIKNYERWEGLREEYDDQKRTQRESRSLDIQRTGTGGYDNGYGYGADDRPILTLRDQQEANDARTGWRPQESWETTDERRIREQATGYQPVTAHGRPSIERPNRRSLEASSLHSPRPGEHRSISLATGYDEMRNGQYQPPTSIPPAAQRLSGQKTGAVWDEALPPRLAVTKRNFDEDSRTNSQVPSRNPSVRNSMQPSPQPSIASVNRSNSNSKAGSYESLPRVSERPENIHATESHIPGGFMAELIEGQKAAQAQATQMHRPATEYTNNPFEQQLRPNPLPSPPTTSNPFNNPGQYQTSPYQASNGFQTGGVQPGYQPNGFAAAVPTAPRLYRRVLACLRRRTILSITRYMGCRRRLARRICRSGGGEWGVWMRVRDLRKAILILDK